MQTFPLMQRNRANFWSIRFWFFATFLMSYQVATSVFTYLPPLIGIFIVGLLFLNYERERTLIEFDFRWYLAIAYLFISEQIHGFALLSAMMTFLIYYYFVADWLMNSIKFRSLLLVITVCCAYLGVYEFTNIILYMKNEEFIPFGNEYLLYMGVESILALIFFKDKLL